MNKPDDLLKALKFSIFKELKKTDKNTTEYFQSGERVGKLYERGRLVMGNTVVHVLMILKHIILIKKMRAVKTSLIK